MLKVWKKYRRNTQKILLKEAQFWLKRENFQRKNQNASYPWFTTGLVLERKWEFKKSWCIFPVGINSKRHISFHLHISGDLHSLAPIPINLSCHVLWSNFGFQPNVLFSQLGWNCSGFWIFGFFNWIFPHSNTKTDSFEVSCIYCNLWSSSINLQTQESSTLISKLRQMSFSWSYLPWDDMAFVARCPNLRCSN